MDKCLTLLPKSKNRNDIKIREASLELFGLTNSFKETEDAYKKRKSELQKIIFSGGYKEFTVDNLDVKCIQSNKIVWDMDKLKSNIGKELFNEVTDKTYTINDYKGLVKYLKSCGVNPKKFAQFINVEKKVNNKRVDELSELGEITVEDLQDTYTLEKISEYVKFYDLEEG